MKHLEQQLSEIEGKILGLRAQLKPLQQEISRLDIQRQDVVKAMQDASKEPRVSDHAVVRYLERKYGFSFDDVRAEILSPDRASAIRAGAKRISHDGVAFIVKDRTIVTVMD